MQSNQPSHLHSAYCQPALRVRASIDYFLFCDDPVSFQSLVPWVQSQFRVVELKDALLSLGSTSADLHFLCVLTPVRQGVLNLLCGNLQRPLFMSLVTKNGFQPLPPTLDIRSVSVHVNSKFPEETTVQLTNPANSSGHS